MYRHKYSKGQSLKYLLSLLFSLFQFLISKTIRPKGISVMIRVRDEEDWIAKSLLSLNEFADEVVVVNNNSVDHTLDEIEKVKKHLKYKLILVNETSGDICKVSNHALSLTSYRWIFRWDSDFIAHTSGKQNIKYLREYLLNLNSRKYYLIYPITVSFAGDLFHVKTGRETNSEGYIHTWHPKLKYQKKGKFEYLKVPFFFRIIRWQRINFVHIGNAKPLKKILFRFFWLYWQNHLAQFPEIEDYIDHELKEKHQGISAEQFAINEFRRLILPVRKFEKSEFGEYPELMKKDLEKPQFEMIYQNGKPFSRNDFTVQDRT